jgi:hypothetical protein
MNAAYTPHDLSSSKRRPKPSPGSPHSAWLGWLLEEAECALKSNRRAMALFCIREAFPAVEALEAFEQAKAAREQAASE